MNFQSQELQVAPVPKSCHAEVRVLNWGSYHFTWNISADGQRTV